MSGSGSYTHMTMVAENATGLRNLFKLSSLASFEGQLGKWSRMDAELIAEHASRHHRHHRLPVRGGADPAAARPSARGAGVGGQVAGDLRSRELLSGADGPRAVHRAPGARGPAGNRPRAQHSATGHQRLPLRHPRRRAQPRGAAVRADRQDAHRPHPVQVRRRRLLPQVGRRDARDLGRRGGRRLRLDSADRRAGQFIRRRVGPPRPDAGLPGARRPRPGILAATRGRGRPAAPFPRSCCPTATRSGPRTRSKSSATRVFRPTSSSSPT